MPGAGYKSEELQETVGKVEQLRDEEKQNSFAELSRYSYDSKRHSSEVRESVADECSCWVPEHIGK